MIPNEMITLLEQFSLENIVEPIKNATKRLLQEIRVFNKLDEKNQQGQADHLRKELLIIFNDRTLPTTFVKDVDFKSLLCNILVKLAERFPVDNGTHPETGLPLDPVLYLPIQKSDQFFTITGQVFSVSCIINYNKTRTARGSLGETAQKKFLLNPLTNDPFLPIDMERLILIAVKKGESLDFIIDQPTNERMGFAGLSQGPFTLKRFVSFVRGENITVLVDDTKEFQYSQQDAVICLRLCLYHDEEKTFGYLYNRLEQPYKNLLTLPQKLKTNQIIEKSSANAFIWMLARHNESKTLREIVNKFAPNVDLNYQYRNGFAAIHFAAQFGSIEAMKILCDQKYKILPDLRDEAGGTAAIIAAENKKIDIVRMLAEKGANLMIPRYDGRALIHVAATQDDTELMQLLLDYKVSLNQARTLSGRTATHEAALHNSTKVTAMLLSIGVDFNAASGEGFSPLHYAAYAGSVEVMQLLFQQDNIERDPVSGGSIPHRVSTIAAERGHISVLKLLAKMNIALDKPRTDFGATPLHRAVLNHHYAAAAFLIEHYVTNHINIFANDVHNQSAFRIACGYKNWNVAKLFMNKIEDDKIPESDKELMKMFGEELGLTEEKTPISNGQLLATLGLHASSPRRVNSPLEEKREEFASQSSMFCTTFR